MRDRMAPERLLAELVDGVLGRFGGQRLELDLRATRCGACSSRCGSSAGTGRSR